MPYKTLFFSHPSFIHKVKSALFWNSSLAWVLTPPIMQRILVIQDKKMVRKTWYTGALVLGCIAGIINVIGLIALVNKGFFKIGQGQDKLLLYLVKFLFSKEPLVIDILLIGFLSLGVSTMDSYLHSAGLSFVQDLMIPIQRLMGKKVLNPGQKIFFSRVGILMIGGLAPILGAMDSVIKEQFLNVIIVYIYTLISVPLVLGILGFKTDRKSWYSFIVTYGLAVGVLYSLGWSKYGNFILSLGLGISAYLMMHLYVNGGFVMLEGVWPRKLQQYFPLYWLFTVFYCLPLSGTLVFLLMHSGIGSYTLFIANFVLLAMAIRSKLFVGMSLGGLGLANVGIYGLAGGWMEGVWMDGTYLGALGVVLLLVIAVVALMGGREKHAYDRLYITKAFASAMPHESLGHLHGITKVAYTDDAIHNAAVPIKDHLGIEGKYISKKKCSGYR